MSSELGAALSVSAAVAPWVENNDGAFPSRAARAHLANAAPLAALVVVFLLAGWWDPSVLWAWAFLFALIAVSAYEIDSRMARATAVTHEALLVRLRRQTRTYPILQLEDVRAARASVAGPRLRVQPLTGKALEFYGLPAQRIEEIVGEVDAERARTRALPTARLVGAHPEETLPSVRPPMSARSWAVAVLDDGQVVPDSTVAASVGAPSEPVRIQWESETQRQTSLVQTMAFVTTIGLITTPIFYAALVGAGVVSDWRQACLAGLAFGVVTAAAFGKRFYIGQRGRCRIELPPNFAPIEARSALVRAAATRAGCPIEGEEGSGHSREWHLVSATKASREWKAEAMDAGIKVTTWGSRPPHGPELVVETWGRANIQAHARFKGAVLELVPLGVGAEPDGKALGKSSEAGNGQVPPNPA